jgi:hypothetical protein
MKIVGLLLVIVTGCNNKTQEPAPQGTQAPQAPQAITAPLQAPKAAPTVDPGPMAAPGELAWQAPASFQVMPNPNSMRKATYKIAKVAGDSEDGELAVSLAGGDPEANITRWEGQFEGAPKAKRSEVQVDALKVIVVEIAGTFMSGMMGGQAAKKSGFMMLGAMAPNGGGQATFFKLTGPEKTVRAARPEFEKLLKSLKPQK